jgi:AraC-like DNA-binding protein
MPRLGGLPDEAAARLERLALHLQPEAAEWHIVLDTIARLQDDTRRAMPAQALTPLLHHQLCALIHRLHGMSIGQSAPAVSRRNALMRFQAFQTLLEREHRSHHQVAWYAEVMGCSEKSLSRATLATVGMTAKAFIASQRVLEAKRLLIHTSRSVTAIGGSLGFDETTNFVKFFKREVGRTPSQFRASRPPP